MALCRGCGADKQGAEDLCPFCGHDASFERLQKAQRSIGYFWKAVIFLFFGGLLLMMGLMYFTPKTAQHRSWSPGLESARPV